MDLIFLVVQLIHYLLTLLEREKRKSSNQVECTIGPLFLIAS